MPEPVHWGGPQFIEGFIDDREFARGRGGRGGRRYGGRGGPAWWRRQNRDRGTSTRKTGGPVDLKTAIKDLQGTRESFGLNRTRTLTALANAGERGIADARRGAALTSARLDRAAPTSYADAIAGAERRAKARQGVVNRGEAAVRNQQLKDRLQIAQGQASRRGTLINVLQNAANIKEGVNTGVSDANNRIRESQAAMWGNIAGAAGAIGKNWWDNRQANQTPAYTGTPQMSPIPQQQQTGLTVFGDPQGGDGW